MFTKQILIKLVRRKSAMLALLLAIIGLTAALPFSLKAAPGDLDTTFGAGKTTTQIGSSDDNGYAAAVQSDGKIVVSGRYYVNSTVGWLAALTRYNADGTLDTTFGTGGKVTQNYANNNFEEVYLGVAIQSDGKIVCGGYYHNGTHYNFITARFNSNGTNDSTFNGGGFVAKDIGEANTDDFAYSVAIQSDSKIVVAGSTGSGSTRNSAFVRYNTNGTLDTTFDGDGDKVVEVSNVDSDAVYSIAIQPDGKIIGVGDVYPVNGGISHFSAVRLTPSGALDNSFDSNGILSTQIGSGNSVANAVKLQTDGKIVGAGTSFNGSNYDFTLVRYNSDGSLDNSFDVNGILNTPVGNSSDAARAVAIQTDGKIVAAGYGYSGTYSGFALVRYNGDGSLDTTFDGDGLVIKNLRGFNDAAHAIALQSDGKMVVAGLSGNGSNHDFAVARFNTNGLLDTTFAPSGKVTTAIGSGDDSGAAVALQSDGKTVVAGSFYNGSNYDFAVVRYNADGFLDNSFGNTGKVTTSIGSGDDRADAVIIQPDGKIIAAGYYINGTAGDSALVRYNANGTLDTTFGSGGKVTTQTSSSTENIYALAIQPDGRILAAGRAVNGASGLDFVIVRYNSNGTLDGSFNGSGIRLTNFFSGTSDTAQAIAVQTDGKIVVAGSAYNGSSYEFALIRFNSNGSHDAATTTNVGAASSADEAFGMAIQPDGKIIAAGLSDGNFGIVRYNANFSLDTSFDFDGKVTTNLGGGSIGYGVVLQPDGKILVGGTTNSGNDFALARYNTDGSLDTNFSGDGKLTTDINGAADSARGIALQADGKIILAGYAYNGANNDFAVARYLPGADCSYSISPASVNVSAAAVNGSVTVTPNETYCAWTAVSNDPWLTVTGGASGTGSGTVNYSAAANTGAARTGTITVAGQTFTLNQAAALDVSIPTNIQSLKNNTVVIPVNVSDTTGKGVISYDFTVTYDASVLTPLAPAFDATGTISGNFNFNVNSGTPGQILISGYGTQPLTGAGTMLYLRFTASGNAPACSSVGFSAFIFNDGNPGVNTSNGQVCIVNGAVSGTVTNGNSAGNLPVPNVTLTGAGGSTISATTAANGTYLLEGFGNGTYTVTPSKSGDVNGAVSSLDAAMVSRYAVGFETLSANQMIVADVSGSNTVNSYDAALISQYVVLIANPGSAGTWKFIPASRTYSDLTSNQPDQNYTALLMGDVTGNWTAPNAFAELSKIESKTDQAAVAVSLPAVYGGLNQTITVPVSVGEITGRGVLSFDTEISFDPAVLQLDAVAPFDKNGTLSSSFAATPNINLTGRILLSAYGASVMQGSGALINLRFKVIGQPGQVSPLVFERFVFNEDGTQSVTANGQVTVLAPTTADVSVSGRAVNAKGQGIANVLVTLTDATGNSRTVKTGTFGYYRFNDIPAGADYTITVAAKKYSFENPTRVISVTDELTEVDFIALD